MDLKRKPDYNPLLCSLANHICRRALLKGLVGNFTLLCDIHQFIQLMECLLLALSQYLGRKNTVELNTRVDASFHSRGLTWISNHLSLLRPSGSQAEGKRNTLSAGRIQGLIRRIMKYTQFRARMSDDVLTHRRRMIHFFNRYLLY